jgi:hypothetical protein
MKNALNKRLLSALPICFILAGCVSDQNAIATSSADHGSGPYIRGDLGTLTYRAVDLLLSEAPELNGGATLVVSSIAEVTNLDHSSAMGNIVADMIRTRLVQQGHTTSEFRLRNALTFNHGEGEFLLSRNRRALMGSPNAAAIVTGTYAVSFDKVYISLKLVAASNARILSGADFVVSIREVEGLLATHA